MRWTFLPFFLSYVTSVGAKTNSTWPPANNPLIDSLSWPVSQVIPKFFNIDAKGPKGCSMDLVSAFEDVLGMSRGSLLASLGQILNMEPQHLINRMDEARIKTQMRANLTSTDLQGLEQTVLGGLMLFQDVLSNTTVIDPKGTLEQVDDTHILMSELGSILNIDLNAVDDLLTGFLTSRLMGEILTALASNSLDDGGWPFSAWTNVSPMVNVGSKMCSAFDVSRKLDRGSLAKRQTVVALVVSFLACKDSTAPKCSSPSTPYNITASCEKMKVNSSSVLELPLRTGVKEIKGATDPVVLEEGPTYFALWVAMEWVQAWAENAQCNFAPPSEQILPGWNIIQDFWLKEDSSSQAALSKQSGSPYTAVAQRADDQCEILVITRGTWTPWEWQADVTAQLDPSPHSQHEQIHRGYLSISNAMLPILEDVVANKVFTGKCNEENTRFIVSGMSMGGGMTYVWANRISHLWPKSRVDVVAFAPARSLSVSAMDWVVQNTNVRTFIADLDMVPRIPCQNDHGLVRVPGRLAAGIEGVGEDPSYAAYYNVIQLSPQTLAAADPYRSWFFNDAEFLTTAVKLLSLSANISINIPSPLQISANHDCSYPCFLSANFCTDDPTKFHSCDMNTKICPEEMGCPNPAPLVPDPDKPDCPPYPMDAHSGATRKCNNPIASRSCAVMTI